MRYFFCLLRRLFFLRGSMTNRCGTGKCVRYDDRGSRNSKRYKKGGIVSSILRCTRCEVSCFSQLGIGELHPFRGFQVISRCVISPFLRGQGVFFCLFHCICRYYPRFQCCCRRGSRSCASRGTSEGRRTSQPYRFLCYFFLLFRNFSRRVVFCRFR